MQKRLIVDRWPQWVGVYHERAGHWIAVGDTGGKLLAAVGHSERAALEAWRKKAIATLCK